MLNKELSHLSESSRSGNMISEYICTTFLGKFLFVPSVLYIEIFCFKVSSKFQNINQMSYVLNLDKSHDMDLLTSHQVDATVEEEEEIHPSGDEEEENQKDRKSVDTASNKGSTIDTTAVPKLSENNKFSPSVGSIASASNKSSVVTGTSNSS